MTNIQKLYSCVYTKLLTVSMLEIKNGTILKDKRILIDQITQKFENHRIYGLVGINGSGKTMILKALSGFHKLTQGDVYQNDRLIGCGKRMIANAGLVLGQQEFICHFTLEENLRLIKKICSNKKMIDLHYWINLYHIEKYRKTLYKDLSLGTKKKMRYCQ
ncbi:ATP-binding cassette domain-containing protein [Streptococcus iniae]|uniref:ATP-binding cassette domain-containing protein n=2 Tax=Streptococcus iniae TaxID=1346 RepID=UPI00217D4E85|nr:ATP-binding cassette domain-containing protein [Streptococcus iniae]